MAKIFLGTSGYSYKDWIGPFYPAGSGVADFLSFYATQFPFVELNFSYYSMPKPEPMKRMIEKTPPRFLFAVKAHESLTHTLPKADGDGLIDREALAVNAEIFRKGIQPLAERERLAAVLLQFPYSFHYTPANRSYLDVLASLLAGLPLAAEFRNDEWVRDQVMDGLRQRGVAFVNVDQPPLPKLIRPSALVTAETAYVRFHGRNKTNWWQGDNVSRYDYLYSDEELASWIENLRLLAQRARIVIIAFNNHSRAQAVQNARRLKVLLLEQGLDAV